MKRKGTRIVPPKMNNNKVRGYPLPDLFFPLPDFKTSYKATVILKVWYWQKKINTEISGTPQK